MPARRPAGTRPPLTAILVAALTLLVAYAGVNVSTPVNAASTLLSQGKPAAASSVENAVTPASAAVDGDTGTRWSSAAGDPQWLRVDLGTSATVSQVVLTWETAYGTAFQIQVSDDAATWTTIYSTTTGTGGTQTLNVSGTGRYVRMYGTARATQWGYSLWEFQVYGSTGSTPPPGTTPISAYKQVRASSTEGGNAPAAALDGRTNTRWSSLATDDQWLQIDLGGPATITGATLIWENAYATGYRIEVSDNGTAWSSIYTTTTGKGGTENLGISGKGRYVRFHG